MKRLTPPEPHIELYEEGFTSSKDLLGRAETGQALSDLVERIDEPMVVALDGGWGEGKTFFLKCWVGEHFLNDEYSTQTVYFDAFENDYADEPLASLLGVILARFEEDSPNSTVRRTIGTLKKVALPLTRLGLAVASYGATEAGGALVDALTKQTEKELEKAAKYFWKKEDGRRAAMGQFRNTLIELTMPRKDGTPTQKLVIVVDELDRCRPDYALSLLEIIKHFFDVPGVHFVLGANMRELENTVRARYGAGIDAGLYLQKFVTLSTKLSDNRKLQTNKCIGFFETQAKTMELNPTLLREIKVALKLWRNRVAITLRSMQRLLQVAALTPSYPDNFKDLDSRDRTIVASLLVFKTLDNLSFRSLNERDANFDDIEKSFRIDPTFRNGGNSTESFFYDYWASILLPRDLDKEGNFRLFGNGKWGASDPFHVSRLIRNYVERFESTR